MIPSLRPEPKSELPENAGADRCELADDEQIDAFCEELLAALTQLERSPAAKSARDRARIN